MAFEVSQNGEGFWQVAGVAGYYANEATANRVRGNLLDAQAENGPPIETVQVKLRPYINPAIQPYLVGPGLLYDFYQNTPWTAAGAGPGKTITSDGNAAFPGVAQVGQRLLYFGALDNPASFALRFHWGIYVLTDQGGEEGGPNPRPWRITRAADFDYGGEIRSGAAVSDGSGVQNNTFIVTVHGGESDDLDVGDTWIRFTTAAAGPELNYSGHFTGITRINDADVGDYLNPPEVPNESRYLAVGCASTFPAGPGPIYFAPGYDVRVGDVATGLYVNGVDATGDIGTTIDSTVSSAGQLSDSFGYGNAILSVIFTRPAG